MLSVMHEIEDYVLDSPIALFSAYDKTRRKIPRGPKSHSDFAEVWDDAQTRRSNVAHYPTEYVAQWQPSPFSRI